VITNAIAGPFITTIALGLAVTTYMTFAPAHAVRKFMQLSKMSWDYEIFLLGLGISYLVVSWAYEKHGAPRLARALRHVKERLTGREKKRKEYKVILEVMKT
jgi:cation-transporting ATPase 13A3/4/5